jgi:hypothetical protein
MALTVEVPRMFTLPLLALIAGCESHPSEPWVLPVATSAHQLRAGGSGTTTFVSVDILATSTGGDPIPCSAGALDVDVSVSLDGGARWAAMRPGSVVVRCGDASPPDLSVVIDNSGSQESLEDPTRDGASRLVQGVLDLGGRAALVRVSTFAAVLADLTADSRGPRRRPARPGRQRRLDRPLRRDAHGQRAPRPVAGPRRPASVGLA